MKKTLAMMSVLLLAGTLLSGCGKKAVEETTAVPADTQGTTQAETETTAAAAAAVCRGGKGLLVFLYLSLIHI